MQDLVSLRDCPGPVTLVIASDGTRRPFLARNQKGCGRPYAWPWTSRHAKRDLVLRALACERCADNTVLKLLLAIGLEPRHLSAVAAEEI
jgi:hypothetical protein